MHSWEIWLKGIAAAGIAGGANGVITGFAAVGIDPSHFNLQSGLHSTLAIAGVSALMSGIIGIAAYLKQSPLPKEP
jgi:hypothetical protein